MTGHELNQLAAQLAVAAATLKHGHVADPNRQAVDSFFEIRDMLVKEFEAKKRKKVAPPALGATAAAMPMAPPPAPAGPRHDPPRPAASPLATPLPLRTNSSRHDRNNPLRRGR